MSERYAWARVLIAAVFVAGCGEVARVEAQVAAAVELPADLREPAMLDVKFKAGTSIRLIGNRPRDQSTAAPMAAQLDALVRDLPGVRWQRAHRLAPEALRRLRERGARRSRRAVPDMELYQRIVLPATMSIERARRLLLRSAAVEAVFDVSRPPPPPLAPDYSLVAGTPYQSYLNAAPLGVDARAAWDADWQGAGVSICDVEYDFNSAHVDLPPITRLATANDPFNSTHHGTSVMGVMLGLHNSTGVRGIAYAAGPNYFAPAVVAGQGYNVANAVLECAAVLAPGDVLVIEQQAFGPNYTGGQAGLVPPEWDRQTYDAIRTAVANDILVIEAAGNGAENLDSDSYTTGNGDHWPFLAANDSGALIVTAGVNSSTHGPLGFSNIGSTIDLQGWGQGIVTTGAGSLYSAEGINAYYTAGFNGSSGATAMVAGAIATLQSGFKALTGDILTPAQVRFIARASGTPGSGTLANVPFPNLTAARARLVLVDASATGANDGSSWANARTSLASTLAGATAGTMVMVAEGEYFPTTPGGPRTASFLLSDGVVLVGGYPSGGGARDPDAHKTYLSCNIDGDAALNSAGDCHHVVNATGAGATTVLDGFVIRGGHANGAAPHDSGAGLSISGGAPTVRHTLIEENVAIRGGGIATSDSAASLEDVVVRNNVAQLEGGGLYASDGTGLTVTATDVRFHGNSAARGGGIAIGPGGKLLLENAILSGNSAQERAGGIDVAATTPGALNVISTTLAGNSAPTGGSAVSAVAAISIASSIVWGNGSTPLAGPITVADSFVEGGWSGINVTNANPLLRDPNGSDDITGSIDDDLRLMAGTPALGDGGTGCTPADIDGHARIGTCEPGAHEYAGEPGSFWSNGALRDVLAADSVDRTPLGQSRRISADDFHIANATACDVSGVRAILADPTSPLGATFELYADSGGVPGSLIATYPASALPTTSLGQVGNVPTWQYRFDFTPLRLAAGDYWAAIYGRQETTQSGRSRAVAAGESVRGRPYMFRSGSGSWVDGANTQGAPAHDISLDIDAVCGCAADNACDDGNPATVDSCVNLVCQHHGPAPENDNAGAASTVIAGQANGTMVDASNDGNASVGLPGTADVWFRYTATSDVVVTFDTCGSHDIDGLDSVISIHDDASGTVGAERVANNDWAQSTSAPGACTGGSADADAAVALPLTAGTSVYVRIAQYSSATTGSFVLNVRETAFIAPLQIPTLATWARIALLAALVVLGASACRRPRAIG